MIFLSCKANARVLLTKTGHGPQLPCMFHSVYGICYSVYRLCDYVLFYVPFMLFSVLFTYFCELYYCHRVSAHLQFNNNNNNETVQRDLCCSACGERTGPLAPYRVGELCGVTDRENGTGLVSGHYPNTEA